MPPSSPASPARDDVLDPGSVGTFEISFPAPDEAAADQDSEHVVVIIDGEPERIRLHDYERIYSLPGLYEQLFYEHLLCDSPRTVCELLGEVAVAVGQDPETLCVLDVGAGNGMVGERLDALGAESIVGVDILEEAGAAVERDRPGVYDDYLVADLADLDRPQERSLRDRRFNALTCVAALGFGDIPPAVFAAGYELLFAGGLVAISIKETFLAEEDRSGFSTMIRGALADGALELKAQRRFRHRLSASGEPLHYVALVAEKRGSLRVP